MSQKPHPKGYPSQLESIGDHLRKVRMDQGLSQRQVAILMGVPEQRVYKWENNLNKPKIRYGPQIILPWI